MSGSSGTRWAWMASLLLLTVALAGCASDQGPAGEDGTEDEAISSEEARSTYANAATVFEDGPSDATRVGMKMSFKSENATGNQTGTVDALADEDKQLMIMSMSGRFAGSAGGQGTSESIETFVAGQVHKTNFFGVPPDLLGFYNESATPPEGFTSVETNPDPGPGSSDASSGFADPTSLMSKLAEDPPEDATFTATETTYNGQPAVEIETTYTDANATYDVRAVVYTDPSRPALFEGSVEPTPAAGPEVEAGTFEVEFTYDEDATHDLEEGLTRLETMVFAGEPQGFGGGADTGRFTNHTIKPSKNAGMVPLHEVQVVVTTGAGGPSSSSDTGGPVLTLDAEQGSAQTGEVRVTYEDADGDGAVSPGDRIVLEDRNTSDSKTFSVKLHDEVSGLNLSAGAGLFGLVAGALAAGAIARRSRR